MLVIDSQLPINSDLSAKREHSRSGFKQNFSSCNLVFVIYFRVRFLWIMPSQPEIPDSVKGFIAKHIRSVEQLEILILLSAAPENIWTVQKVAQHIQSDEASIASCLEELQSQGFLIAKKMPGLVYQFSCSSEELLMGVKALTETYRKQRIKVIEVVLDKSQQNLRNFSDAFKIRRKDDS
jgi:hypothetical protein